jgi:hypothetical protein
VQAVKESSITAVLKTDHFDCDLPSEQAVLGKEHFARSATTESCLNNKTIGAAACQIADWRLQHGNLPTKNYIPATDCVAAGLAFNVTLAGVVASARVAHFGPGQI